MKILLINPPRSPFNGILEHASSEAKPFIHKKLVGPPLGLITLASAVKDHDVVVFDMKGEYDLFPDSPKLPEMVKGLITEHRPDVVGTTVITSELYYGQEILQTAKAVDPTIVTIIGGQFITACLNESYHPAIDVAVKGHGGGKLRDIAETIEKGDKLNKVAGIFVNNGKQFEKTKAKEKPWDAAKEDFLLPDRSLLEKWRQTYRVKNAPAPVTYLFSSLGCPYNCTFCSIWKENNGKYFLREIESIINELKLIDYEIVRFADANTIIDAGFIDKLFSRIEEEQITKEFVMDIRADTAVEYPHLIKKLAKNGLKVVICGFESFRETELNKYNKRSSASLIEKAVKIFHDNGIMIRGNYVVPVDYSQDDFYALASHASSNKTAYAGYSILTPMPGTDYYNQVKQLINDHDLRKYNFFNAVLPTLLPLESFYKEVASLWLIRKGKDVI